MHSVGVHWPYDICVMRGLVSVRGGSDDHFPGGVVTVYVGGELRKLRASRGNF